MSYGRDYHGLALWRSRRHRRGGTRFLARLEGVHSARGHRQRPQRRWRPRCGPSRWQLDRRSSGTGGVARPAQRCSLSSKATTPYPAKAIRFSSAMSTAMATPIWSCWEGIRLSGLGGVFVLINQGTPATAVAAEAAAPTTFALGANYPNPFNPTTTIPLGRARWSQKRGLNYLQRPRAANAPSVDGAAVGWRASADLGWPRCAGSTRCHWGLCVSVTSGRADAHPQNGQTRIGDRAWRWGS